MGRSVILLLFQFYFHFTQSGSILGEPFGLLHLGFQRVGAAWGGSSRLWPCLWQETVALPVAGDPSQPVRSPGTRSPRAGRLEE
jgi:hypothetical protein